MGKGGHMSGSQTVFWSSYRSFSGQLKSPYRALTVVFGAGFSR
jgi:hypothetical protein